MTDAGILVIGIGNLYRGDDAVGRHVVRALKEKPPANSELIEMEGQTADLMEAWRGADRVIIVDACQAQGQPGRTHRIVPSTDHSLPSKPLASAHGLGLAEAVALSQILKIMPQMLVVFAIEGLSFDLGRGLSPPVAQAVPRVAAWLRDRESLFSEVSYSEFETGIRERI